MKLPSKNLLFRESPMKFALWVAFTITAALWSGTVLATSELTKWLAASVPRGKPEEAIAKAGDQPVPEWLSTWVDPAWVEGFQAQWLHVLGWLGQTGPTLESAVGWLIPLLWVVWGVVMLAGLVVAVTSHFLIGRICRSTRLKHTPA